MKIGIPKESSANETRVAATAETVGKLVKAGMSVSVEKDAGMHSHIKDEDYVKAGAIIEPDRKRLYQQSDVILKVNRPAREELDDMKHQSILIAPLYLQQQPDVIKQLNEKKITAFALEWLPRIARAQAMDILSSMSSIAGYKSIIMASNYLGKVFPMMTTAAGTLMPAKIIIIGAGVAGLQAIATARRLGGVVLAFDTRPIVAEQVKSLGADFVSLEVSHEKAEDAGGYAKEQTADFYQQEQHIIQQYLKDVDVIVTTALIPGKKAPILLTEQMVRDMRPGSVIVDLSVEQGGNCELSEAGKIVTKHEITLIGTLNLPGTVPVHASQMYAKNVLSFLMYVAPQLASGQFDFLDDIIKGALVTHQGETLHPNLKQTMATNG